MSSLLDYQLHHHCRLSIRIISQRLPHRAKSKSLIDRNHRRITLAAICHNASKSVAPRIVDLPLLHSTSHSSPPIFLSQPRALNVERPSLLDILVVTQQILPKLHVMNKCGATRHSPVHHNPVRLQTQPIVQRKSHLLQISPRRVSTTPPLPPARPPCETQ